MPLYEYECERDGRFEVIRKYSDPPVESCPTCGGSVDKLPSAPAIQFKGSGWYVTDYARKSGGDSTSSDDTKSGGNGKSGEKSDGNGKTSEKSASNSAESKPSGGSRTDGSSSSSSSSSRSSSPSPSPNSK